MDKLKFWIIFIATIGLVIQGASSAKYRDLAGKCAAEGGVCAEFSECDTVSHIYKGYCKTDYSQVCCVSRALVCDSHDGICTDDPEACEAAGAIMGIKYQIQFKTWLTCNATHTCCRPLPKDKETGMDNFKSLFPEVDDSSISISSRSSERVTVPSLSPAPAPSPAPRISPTSSFAPDTSISSEERQAKIGEAVLAVLAENPSLSLQDAMQHPAVRDAAGEPPIAAVPAPISPFLARESLYSAEINDVAARERQLSSLMARRRQLLQLRRLHQLRQLRQSASAREAQDRMILEQQQQSSSVFPGHYTGHGAGGPAVDPGLQRQMYASGMDFPYARQLPLDPAHQSFNQPHPFNVNNHHEQQHPQHSPFFPYQKQGGQGHQGEPQSPVRQDESPSFPHYTHRTLGEVHAGEQAAPLPPKPPTEQNDLFGFKDNDEFMKEREESYNRYNTYLQGR